MDSLENLEKSLDNLENVLAPLLAKSLPDTLEELELLQKAKLQVLIPYVVNDLVFIYLKSRGINPKEHPVVGELERVKQYFEKIKNAEDPEKRRLAIDPAAANRFIKHAIKESQTLQQQAQTEVRQNTHIRFTETGQAEGSSKSSIAAPNVPTTSAAASAKIEAREAALRHNGDSSEDNELDVIDDDDAPCQDAVGEAAPKQKGNKKNKESAHPKKRKRRKMDPWTGFEDTWDRSGASNSQANKTS